MNLRLKFADKQPNSVALSSCSIDPGTEDEADDDQTAGAKVQGTRGLCRSICWLSAATVRVRTPVERAERPGSFPWKRRVPVFEEDRPDSTRDVKLGGIISQFAYAQSPDLIAVDGKKR